MSGSDFYVTLPSNSSVNYYPENTIANYRTRLPQPIHLDLPYEVAMTEIHYPLSWPHYPEEDSVVTERYTDDSGLAMLRKFIMPVGRYLSLGHLAADMTRLFEETNDIAKDRSHIVAYDPVINRVTIHGGYTAEIMFRGKLARVLGFEPDAYTRIGRLTVAPYPADLYAGIYNMFVYSDIIEHQTVGDHHVQLMRCVHIDETPTKFVTTVYAKPQYHRLAKSHFNSIEISIKSDQNQDLGFTYGKVIIVLHFRPARIN